MAQVALPRLLFGAPILVDDDEIEFILVELLRQLVVTADDCNMMDSQKQLTNPT